MKTRTAVAPPRLMTKRDWKALYLVHRLAEQIVLHGADTLDTFVDAIAATRSTPTEEKTNAE